MANSSERLPQWRTIPTSLGRVLDQALEGTTVKKPHECANLADLRRDSLDLLSGGGSVVQPMPTQGEHRVAVVEHLRLRVPLEGREAWLRAELDTWDPWLRRQNGFVNREILWDGTVQEGVLLIHWASHAAWKAIPSQEVAIVQACFEAAAKRWLALPPDSDNPFPLVYAGEIREA